MPLQCGNFLVAHFSVWKQGKLFGAAPQFPAAFCCTSCLWHVMSGAVFCVYVEDPELPLNYGGGPDETLNSDLLKNRKKMRFFLNSWL